MKVELERLRTEVNNLMEVSRNRAARCARWIKEPHLKNGVRYNIGGAASGRQGRLCQII